MAKKKDTLKDLNEFMKNQELPKEESESYMDKKPTLLANVEKLKSDVATLNAIPADSLYEKDIVDLINKIAIKAQLSPRHVLFNVIEKVLEAQKDKDLIDILLENNVSFLKFHQLIVEKLNT